MPTLDWLNRDAAFRTAAAVPHRLLQAVSTHGDGDARNLLVQGDNLEALKALLPLYRGQVKCIFIDPPYNTKSAFEHYDDNLEHSQWLSMMLPRLQLLREFLRDDGSIWVTIDDNEGHYLKVLMDEVFGRPNFLCGIAWEKRYSPAPDTKEFGYVHDQILVYRKSQSFVRNLLAQTEDQADRYKNPDADPRGPWKAMDYTCRFNADERPNLFYPITHPLTGAEVWPKRNRVWAMSKEVHLTHAVQNRLWWGKESANSVPALKNFLTDVAQGMMPMSIWKHTLAGHNQDGKKEALALFGDAPFSTPKPERLLQQVLHIATNPTDLVLDSFLGSGTTAAVAHKMGRRWIGIEMGEHAATHCLPRLDKVVAGELGGISTAVGWQGGGGFRFMRLGDEVFDAAGRINPGVGFAALAAFVWQHATRSAYTQAAVPGTPLIGVFEGTAIYLLYNGILGDRRPESGNVLTLAVLQALKALPVKGAPHIGTKVVYGEACRLGPARLAAEGLVFRQVPFELGAG
jgi:adenine-specific DNA-methyltransferase